jgi:DNA-binding XRE family transcriptional regulator
VPCTTGLYIEQKTMKITIELYPDEYLHVMRGRLEMTQAQLTRRLGIERRTILRYENGMFKIPSERLDTIKQMVGEWHDGPSSH